MENSGKEGEERVWWEGGDGSSTCKMDRDCM